jgi:hypothetical protein
LGRRSRQRLGHHHLLFRGSVVCLGDVTKTLFFPLLLFLYLGNGFHGDKIKDGLASGGESGVEARGGLEEVVGMRHWTCDRSPPAKPTALIVLDTSVEQ